MPAKLEWAWNGEDAVHVSQYKHLPPQKRPKVWCLGCDRPVVMRLGKKVAHHVAHKPGDECSVSGPETIDHYNAKYRLREIILSLAAAGKPWRISVPCQLCSFRNQERHWNPQPQLLTIGVPTHDIKVEVERRIGTRQPDVLLSWPDNRKLAVEVHAFNAVSDEKAADLKAAGLFWVEVEVSQCGSEYDGNSILRMERAEIGKELTCPACRSWMQEKKERQRRWEAHQRKLKAEQQREALKREQRRERSRKDLERARAIHGERLPQPGQSVVWLQRTVQRCLLLEGKAREERHHIWLELSCSEDGVLGFRVCTTSLEQQGERLKCSDVSTLKEATRKLAQASREWKRELNRWTEQNTLSGWFQGSVQTAPIDTSWRRGPFKVSAAPSPLVLFEGQWLGRSFVLELQEQDLVWHEEQWIPRQERDRIHARRLQEAEAARQRAILLMQEREVQRVERRRLVQLQEEEPRPDPDEAARLKQEAAWEELRRAGPEGLSRMGTPPAPGETTTWMHRVYEVRSKHFGACWHLTCWVVDITGEAGGLFSAVAQHCDDMGDGRVVNWKPVQTTPATLPEALRQVIESVEDWVSRNSGGVYKTELSVLVDWSAGLYDKHLARRMRREQSQAFRGKKSIFHVPYTRVGL